MSDTRWCGNPDVLLSYLYEEDDGVDRQGFEAHLRTCEACAREVREFSALRTGLARWTPPDAVLDFRMVSDPVRPTRSWFAWPAMPAWAQLGAAAMLVGVAVGISGLEIRYDQTGVTVRTGWQQAPASAQAAATPPAPVVQASAPASPGGAAVSDAPWRADLAAVEERLRRDLQQPMTMSASLPQPAAARTARLDDAAFMARVQELITASETRQDRELALRIAQVVRDVDTQRRTDFARLTDSMGIIEGRTVSAVAQQRQMVDYLMRVSSQRDPR